MLFETYQKGIYQVIKINEMLTMNSDISELESIVIEFLRNNAFNIAVYFTGDSFLSSSAGAIIVRCWEAVKDRNGELVFINVNKNILDFLSIIGFTSLNKTYSSDDELESRE